MSRSRYIVVFAVLVSSLISVPSSAQVNDTYVIPVVASVAGSRGTVWSTEFNLFNPHSYPLDVRMIFLPTLTGESLEILVTVDPNANGSVLSVLPELFGVNGTGSLLVATFPEDNPGVPDDVLSRSFLVNTKTFNNDPSGTYGQYVPGVWAGLLDYEFDEISSIAHGIRNSDSIGFRANVGAANLGNTTAVLYVTVYDGNGDLVADRLPFTVPFYGHIQDRLPVAVDGGTVEFFLDDPSLEAVVFPYVSIVDNDSGDAVFMNPVLLADPGILFKHAAEKRELGKKIDTEIARKVKAQARSLGSAKLVTDGSGGYRVVRKD